MNERSFETCKVVCLNNDKIKALKRSIPSLDKLEPTARRHKVLGHAARLAILRILEIEECCVCDIANVLEKPVSTISQHLQLLFSIGVIKSRQEGKLVFYTLTTSFVDEERSLSGRRNQ